MTYVAAEAGPKNRRWSRRIAGLLGVALLLTVLGCTGGTQSTSSGEPANKLLSVGATLEPESMDAWHNAAASIPQVLLNNVYETLIKVDSNGDVQPLLAQTWEISPDRLSYTFHLNPNATFASGAPVDAAAVVANIERLQNDAELTSALKAQLAVVDTASVVEDHKVEIKLTHPSILWLHDMASTLGMMVDPTNTADLSLASAGSGPYQVSEHNIGDSVVLTSNEHYWGNPPRFDQVTFRYFSDPNAMNAAMLSGELDIISNLQAPEALPQFADTSVYNTIVGTTNGEVVLGLNNKTKALSKPEVRQALTMAIDRQALLNTAWAGQGTLIGTMAVPTDPWYEDLSGLRPYDPEQAKALLKKAGYSSGLKLRLRVPVIPYAVQSAQVVASQLRDIGVKVSVEELDFSRWLSEVYTKGDYDMTIVAHVEAWDLGKFADPDYYWHYNDDTFASLYQAAEQAASEEEGITQMKAAARRLADQSAAIWLFALPNIVISKATISGIPPNATTLSFDLTTITSR